MASFTCCSLSGVAFLLFLSAAASAAPLKSPAVVTSASYLSADSDLVDTPGWVRTLYGVHLDDDDDDDEAGRKCVKEDKVFHRPSRGCYLLFTRGPCARYDWLVFDRERAEGGNLTAVCSRRRCAPGWGFDAATGKCFRHGECPAPLVFHYSLFGDGVCRCNGSAGRLTTARPPDHPQTCYPLYQHPPCPKGQMVAPRYRLFEGLDAVCFRDPCDGYKPPGDASSPSPVTTTTPSVDRVSSERPPHDHRSHTHHHHTNGAGNASGPGFDGLTKFQPNFFSRDETISTGQFSQSAFDFEVEVMPVPNRPDLGIKTSTRAVVGSNNNNTPPRSVAGNNGSPAPTNVHHHHHHLDFQQRQEAVPMHRHGLPGFKITLTPFRLADVTSQRRGGRKRRAAPRPEIEPRSARGAKGEARVDWDGGRVDSRDKSAGAGAGAGASAAWEIPETRGAPPALSPQQPNRGVAEIDDDYALQVQYADGTRSCMTPSQLNVSCDLMMVSLFSDYSELKVPICVNTLFRFAIGRVGKSEECVQNDDGECAKTVTVKSPDPLDWEYE